MGKYEILPVFLFYVVVSGTLVVAIFQRTRVLRILMNILERISPCDLSRLIQHEITHFRNAPAVFFCKRDDLYTMNKAILYVQVGKMAEVPVTFC